MMDDLECGGGKEPGVASGHQRSWEKIKKKIGLLKEKLKTEFHNSMARWARVYEGLTYSAKGETRRIYRRRVV